MSRVSGRRSRRVVPPLRALVTRTRAAGPDGSVADGLTASGAVLLLGGCGDVSGDVPLGGSAAPETVVQVYKDVEFYPACGNEVLDLDGTTWYQLLPEEQRALREDPGDENSLGPASPDPFTTVQSFAPLSQGPKITLIRGINA